MKMGNSILNTIGHAIQVRTANKIRVEKSENMGQIIMLIKAKMAVLNKVISIPFNYETMNH